MASIRVVGISGSLRQGSFNSALLRCAVELAPAGMRIDVIPLRDVPLYDEDVRAIGFPAPVEALRAAIAGADGLLISSPEYNYSVPGVLKNAIDWASRPPDQPFAGKPIAIMGASPGRLGTARMQYHLRQCFIFLDGRVLNRPEVMVSGAGDAFADGKLVDEAARGRVGDLLAALAGAIETRRATAAAG